MKLGNVTPILRIFDQAKARDPGSKTRHGRRAR